ncbi:MAG: hypothetical protein GC182_12600 [Rhodopseudomonas sp.]|nr:hypothetical protein [Rhodopseudomonas sp.]
MLPIFRTVTVGGVLLAMILLALALSPRGRSQTQFSTLDAPARGVMIDASSHPEWRQFIILAAFQRASELSRLRDLPDTPTRLPEIPFVAPDYIAPEFPEFSKKSETNGTVRYAGLPDPRDDAGSGPAPNDETGSINVAPHATMPIEIGERSSTELPIAPAEDKPPVTTLPLTEVPTTEAPRSIASPTTGPAQAAPAVAAPAAKTLATPIPRTKVATTSPSQPTAVAHKKIVRHRRAKAKPPTSQAQPQAAAATADPLRSFFDGLERRSVAPADAATSSTASGRTSPRATRKTANRIRRTKTKTAATAQPVSQ